MLSVFEIIALNRAATTVGAYDRNSEKARLDRFLLRRDRRRRVVHFDFDGHDVWRFRQGTAGTDKKANGDD